ncbi:hypothetical protein H3V53_39145 [Paraburkholderia bengalensis]|uniref:Uncharacterized protein n=1 Tax=Paraburkholderia bengalensis TaxID=2747562 RepID=A0ABU8J5Q8_9BURK
MRRDPNSLPDPYTAEVIRYLFQHDLFVETIESFNHATESHQRLLIATEHSIRRGNEVASLIQKAADEAKSETLWGAEIKRIAEAVNLNAYAALDSIAESIDDNTKALTEGTLEQIKQLLLQQQKGFDETLKRHQRAFDESLLQQQKGFDRRLESLEAAANGETPLPIAPHNAQFLQRFSYACRRWLRQLHQWCLDALPPLLITAVLAAGVDIALRAHLISR